MNSAKIPPTNKKSEAMTKTLPYAETWAFKIIKDATSRNTVAVFELMMVCFAIFKTLFSILLESIVAKIATPKAPAMFLIRTKIEDAVPISSFGADDAMMFVLWDIPSPSPNAIMDKGIIIFIAVERGSRSENNNKPPPAMNVPPAMIFPGLILCPSLAPRIAPIIKATAIGTNKYPVWVAEYPKKLSAKSGIRKTLPINPMNTINVFIRIKTKVLFLKNLKSIRGSSWCFSIK